MRAVWAHPKPVFSQTNECSFYSIHFVTLCGYSLFEANFLRPDWNNFEDRWSENVCLQNSESSCGPASAATLLRFFDKPASEKQIAEESFTSRRGTENWYLIRTIRRHGLEAKYLIHQPGDLDLPFPAIVGVRLGGNGGAGHFIAVLAKEGKDFVIGDPLIGREILSAHELLERYYFTGFSIIVTTNRN
jgi:ABC-type bacteriocin/lantibiotic exporter with double-glycine peptidase domain